MVLASQSSQYILNPIFQLIHKLNEWSVENDNKVDIIDIISKFGQHQLSSSNEANERKPKCKHLTLVNRLQGHFSYYSHDHHISDHDFAYDTEFSAIRAFLGKRIRAVKHILLQQRRK